MYNVCESFSCTSSNNIVILILSVWLLSDLRPFWHLIILERPRFIPLYVDLASDKIYKD